MSEPLEKHPPVPLGDAELAEYLEFAGRLADAAGRVILPCFRHPIEVEDKSGKAGFDPVTAADRGAEAAIRELIGQTYPEHGILGEEYALEQSASGLTWVIDPIDGTKAFISGMPLWGTLIALHDGRKPVLGLLDQPYLGERFTGSRLGARLRSRNGTTALRTRPCPALSEAVLYTTHPALLAGDRDRAAYAALEAQVRLSRYGGDCYNYAMLALGFVDLVIESGLKAWDVQALIPIVEAAGGRISDWSGAPVGDNGQVLAAGDPRLHARAIAELANAG